MKLIARMTALATLTLIAFGAHAEEAAEASDRYEELVKEKGAFKAAVATIFSAGTKFERF